MNCKLMIRHLLVAVGWLATLIACNPMEERVPTTDEVVPGPFFRGNVNSLTFASDGQWLVGSVYRDGVYIWDTKSGSLLDTLAVDSTAAALSPTAELIVSVDETGTISLWQPHPAILQHAWAGQAAEGEAPPTITALAFNLLGTQLAAGTDKGVVQIWDVASSTLVTTLGEPSPTASVSKLVFSPDGTRLATSDFGMVVQVWDIAKEQLIQTFNDGLRYQPQDLAWSPDGQWLVATSQDKTGGSLYLWDTDAWQVQQQLDTQNEGVYGVVFDPTSTRLAVGGEGSVQLWSVTEGTLLQTLEGHEDSVTSVAFDASGSTLAAADKEGLIRIWDIQAGTEAARLTLPELPQRLLLPGVTPPPR